jgi:hypothetical protein
LVLICRLLVTLRSTDAKSVYEDLSLVSPAAGS